jgi:hypothetical protein
LVVLGTGCSTPSPHRGAAGYALVMQEKVDGRHDEHALV